MRINPYTVIIFGLFLTSIGLNVTYHCSNQKLIYRIQKLEAGPATGIFRNLQNKEPKPLSDEEINEQIKEMLIEKALQRMV